MGGRCRLGVGRRESGEKPGPRTRTDQAAQDRIAAGQRLCGRDRIRTCVGNAGDFTDRSLWPLGHPAWPRADDTGPGQGPTTGAGSGFQVEPDHVAGAIRLGRGVPGEGEGVEQLEAAAGDRGRAGAVAVEGQRGAVVADLDVEQVGAEGDRDLEGPGGLAGLAVQERVGDGLVDQQPGRLVELGVAQQGDDELASVRDVLEPARELAREPHTSSHLRPEGDAYPQTSTINRAAWAAHLRPASVSVPGGSREGGLPWPTPRSTSSPRSTARRSTTRSTRQGRSWRSASTSRTPAPRWPGRARTW